MTGPKDGEVEMRTIVRDGTVADFPPSPGSTSIPHHMLVANYSYPKVNVTQYRQFLEGSWTEWKDAKRT
jgi:hypothetical protein